MITKTIILNTTISTLWDAITNPESMKKWYFDIPDFKLEVGHKFSFYESDEKKYLHDCKVLIIEDQRAVQYSWNYPEQSNGHSIVTWMLKRLGENETRVTVTHASTDSFKDAGEVLSTENFEKGWETFLNVNLRNYIYGIQRLLFKQEINQKVENVWQKMWDNESYKQWVKPFCEGTFFKGEFVKGNRIHFVTPNGDGMFSDLVDIIPNKLMIFSHIGNIQNFEEQPLDAETQKWTGSFEIYKLEEKNGITTVVAEIDCVPEYIDFMNKTFPLALHELKKISE